MAVQGTKALEVWCKQVTEGYKGVTILNMTTSWRSGLGFCAIIHHFCPELIDFQSLDPEDVFGNNELAFSVAEQHLGEKSNRKRMTKITRIQAKLTSSAKQHFCQ